MTLNLRVSLPLLPKPRTLAAVGDHVNGYKDACAIASGRICADGVETAGMALNRDRSRPAATFTRAAKYAKYGEGLQVVVFPGVLGGRRR